VVHVQTLQLKWAQGQISATADAPLDDLQQMAALAPAIESSLRGGAATTQFAVGGGAGNVNINANVDLAALAAQLPHTLRLQSGVHFDSGALTHQSTVKFADGVATIVSASSVKLAGEVNGTPIDLPAISANLDTSVSGGARPSIGALNFAVDSSFLSIKASGNAINNIQAAGHFDLGDLQKRLGTFANLGSLQLGGTGDLSLKTSATDSAPASPIAWTTGFRIDQLNVSGLSDETPLKIPRCTADGSGTLQQSVTAGGYVLRPSKLNLLLGRPARPAIVLDAGLGYSPDSGSYDVMINRLDLTLPQLIELAKPLLTGDAQSITGQLRDGTLAIPSGTISLTASASSDGSQFSAQLGPAITFSNLTVNRVSAGGAVTPILSNQSATADVHATLLRDATGATTANVNSIAFTGAFGNASIANVEVQLPGGGKPLASPLDVVDSADINLEKIDLPMVSDFYNRLMVVGADDALRASSGSGMFAIHVGHDNGAIDATLRTELYDLGIGHGSAGYRFSAPVVATGEVAIAADATSGAIQSINVKSLDADLSVAKLSVTQPIALADLSAALPTASGAFTITGDVAAASRALEAVSGLPAGSYPYAGNLNLATQFSTERGRVSVAQSGGIANFAVLQSDLKTPSFSESQVTVNNKFQINTRNDTLTANPGEGIQIATASSKALGLTMTGVLHDWETKRVFDGVHVGVDYDLAKLWMIIQPTLSPAQRQSYADLKLTGAYHKDFLLSGSLPGNVPFATGVKSLIASGDLTVDEFSHNGLDATKIDVPIDLHDGVARVAYAGRPAGQEMPTPAACNGGTIDIGGASVDLTADAPRLSTPANRKVLNSVSINSVVGKTAFASLPMFASSDQTTGQVSLTFVKCDRLPLGDLLNSTDASNDGSASLLLDVTNLKFNGGLVGGIDSVISGNLGVASINGGILDIAHGVASSDISLQFGSNASRTLRFNGDTILSSQQLRNYFVTIAPQLLRKWFPGAEKSLPNGLSAPVTGTATSPHLDLKGALLKSAPGLLGGALGGGSSNAGQSGGATQPTDQLFNALGNILGGKKKQQQSNPPAGQ
jgi:hypothetical protein